MKALEGNDEDGIFQAFDMEKFFEIFKRALLNASAREMTYLQSVRTGVQN